MKSINVNTMGFDLNYAVPATIEEYNNLAPKRTNPVLEDANANILYRGVFNKFRPSFLDVLGTITGVARITAAKDSDDDDEKDGPYFKRVIVSVAQKEGLDPAAASTKDTLMARWRSVAQSVLTGGTVSYTNEKGEAVNVELKGIPFDPSEKEGSGGGNLIAKKYIEWVKDAIKAGKHTQMAVLLAKALNRPVDLVGDTHNDKGEVNDESQDIKTLARAIADRERIKREELDRASKAELGL